MSTNTDTSGHRHEGGGVRWWEAAQRMRVERDIHGDGGGEYDAYVMPPRDPHNMWAAITSYAGEEPVLCPVHGCGQHLVWYEAGYVPGYRVCMAPTEDGRGHYPDSIRHRFVLDHADDSGTPGVVLIHDAEVTR